MEIELNRDVRKINTVSGEIDITVIEMTESENIPYSIEPDIKIRSNGHIELYCYQGHNVIIYHYAGGEEAHMSMGIIKNIDGFRLYHNAITKPGSSGAAIVNQYTDKVCAVHCGGENLEIVDDATDTNYSTSIIAVINLINNVEDLTYIKNNTYCGYVNQKKNTFEGSGRYQFDNGEIYMGQFKDNKVQGEGKYFYSDGSSYIGSWQNNQRHGIGKKLDSEGNIVYAGMWKENERNGKGTHYYSNGDYYQGNFKNNKREGQGTYVWKDGRYYIGQYSNDVRHGKGTYFVNEKEIPENYINGIKK